MRCSTCYGTGVIRTILMFTQKKCPDCNGTGDVIEIQPSTPFVLTATQMSLMQQMSASLITKMQQDFFDHLYITNLMTGRPMKTQTEDPDDQLKKEMSRVLLDISGESFFPSTQLYQLANALLIENGSEFLLGVIDEEQHFKDGWEVGRMRGKIEEEVAKVWLNEEKGILCARFPYKEKVITAIRAEIPKGKKSWNPDDKVWEFSVETVDVIVKILTENFDKVIDLTRPAPPMLTSSNGGDSLLSLLDEEDINKIYKLLARKYHPDMGDGSDKMAKINQIFSKKKGG